MRQRFPFKRRTPAGAGELPAFGRLRLTSRRARQRGHVVDRAAQVVGAHVADQRRRERPRSGEPRPAPRSPPPGGARASTTGTRRRARRPLRAPPRGLRVSRSGRGSRRLSPPRSPAVTSRAKPARPKRSATSSPRARTHGQRRPQVVHVARARGERRLGGVGVKRHPEIGVLEQLVAAVIRRPLVEEEDVAVEQPEVARQRARLVGASPSGRRLRLRRLAGADHQARVGTPPRPRARKP